MRRLTRQDCRIGPHLRRAFDWFFRDRTTGKVVIVQWPNWPLRIYIAVGLIRWLTNPQGTVGAAVGVVAFGSLMWWAVDEVVRGVNPFRRLLGAAVAAVTGATLLL